MRAHGRPANRPQRRLAGVAALFARYEGSLAAGCAATLAGSQKPAELVTAWQAAANGQSLVGADRAREIALNLVLPFGLTRPALAGQARWLLAGLRASPAYGKTRFLERNLAPGEGKRFVRTALEQQGLLALLGEWCSRGGCGRCPLSPPAGHSGSRG